MSEPILLRDSVSPSPGWDYRFAPSSSLGAIDNGIGLDVCWRIIRRRWRMIAGLVLAAVLVTSVAVSLMTPRYTAKSTLLIEPEPPQVLAVKQLIDGSESSDDHDYYKTQFELLQSRDLAIRVIRELDLANNQSFNAIRLSGRILGFIFGLPGAVFKGPQRPVSDAEAKEAQQFDIVNHYLGGLKVEPVPGTRLVTVSYTAPNPDLAASIVDRHVHDYVQMGIDLRAQAGNAARDFLAKQLVQIGSRIQNSEAALNAYRRKMGIVAFGVDEKNSLAAQRMGELSKALTEAETRRLTAQAEMKLVQEGDYASLPQVVTNPAITSLAPQVHQLQAEYARLSAAFNPGFPKLDETKAELNAAKAALQLETRDVAKAIDRTYAAAADDEKQLQADIDVEKAKDLAIDDASLRDAVLVRDVETNRQLYQNVLQRMQEMAVTEQAPLSNISIFDNAVVSQLPAYPRKMRDIAIAALLGLMAGLGTAFYGHQQDNRLYRVEEVEEFLGLPSLTLVPDFMQLGLPWWRRRGLSGSIPMRLGFRQDADAVLQEKPQAYDSRGYAGGITETFRMLRTSLLFSCTAVSPRSMIITSSIKGEGKTFTAVNTARVFAHTGARTLLIDADLRRPKCHVLMNTANEAGLTDVLTGGVSIDEAIRSTEIPNLFLLTAGSPASHPAELLTSTDMREMIATLRGGYEILVIDTAPLMIASESCALGTMVDGVVLVVASETPKTNVQRSRQRLEYVGAKVLGVVFNRVNIREPGHHEFLGYYLSYAHDEMDTTV